MDKIVIEGIAGLDGEWDLDLSYFTNRELSVIKRLSGVRAGELDEAFAAGDADLIVAMAAIALRRAGKPVVEDALWDAPAGRISFVADEEADAGPPALTPPASSGSGDEKLGSSGSDSQSDGDASPETILDSTGSLV